ncbi:hypothetical protein BDR26DRAFT_878656 [Obelidium mucronatum]|nr:hypothetical protein BDR26DRAFT_878656 [Obelidium mucronatum]
MPGYFSWRRCHRKLAWWLSASGILETRFVVLMASVRICFWRPGGVHLCSSPSATHLQLTYASPASVFYKGCRGGSSPRPLW